jgi:tetratricopeptide (TPR) repeat protein
MLRKIWANLINLFFLWKQFRINRIIRKGYNFLDLGKYKIAENIFNRIYKLDKDNSQTLLGLGLTQYYSSNYTEALSYLGLAFLKSDGQAIPALAWQGWTYRKLNQEKEAIKVFKHAANASSQDYESLLGRGIALDGLESYEQAIECFRKAIEINSSYQAHHGYSLSLLHIGRHDEAITGFERAISINPKSPLAYRGKGLALSKLEKYDEALKNFDRAIKLKNNYQEALANRGVTLANLSKFYKNKSNQSSKYSEVANLRNIAIEKEKNARLDCEKAINLNPIKPDLWRNQGRMLSILKDNYGAILSYGKAIKLKPDDFETYYYKGLSELQINEPYTAIISFKESVRIKSDYGEAHFEIGKISGSAKEALPHYEKAVKFKKNCPEDWWNRYKNIIIVLVNRNDKKSNRIAQKSLNNIRSIGSIPLWQKH